MKLKMQFHDGITRDLNISCACFEYDGLFDFRVLASKTKKIKITGSYMDYKINQLGYSDGIDITLNDAPSVILATT